MKYLFDANAIIAIFKGHACMLEQLRRHEPRDFGIPTVVMHELYFGAYKSMRRKENIARIEALQFEALLFSPEDARCSGEIRAMLATEGRPIGPYDVLIAGQALSRDSILITRNTREFERIRGLRLENWEEERHAPDNTFLGNTDNW
ncbi:PIN domain-containing protein [Desulfonatronum parangueonense]